MEIRCLELDGTNCYIVREESGQAYVIDPAQDAPAILSALSEMGAAAFMVLLTHAHFDHILAADDLNAGEVYIHEADAPALLDAGLNLSSMVGQAFCVKTKIVPLVEGDTVGCFRVLHTPGHSLGSACFYDEKGGNLFSGDTLFSGGMGRMDLYGGSEEAMNASLQRLLSLPKETKVYPGHGPFTTVEAERKRYVW